MKKKIKKLLLGVIMSLAVTFSSYANQTLYCNGTNVNIRAENNIESEVLGQANVNASFEAIIECNGYWKIKTCNGYAYIASQYLQKDPVPYKYSQHDLYLMAHVLAGEAQPCSDLEQRYVGSVVLNRIQHSEFANSLEAVIYEPGQYSCVKNGLFYREPTKRNWENAEWLLTNGSVLPGYVVYQSQELIGTLYLKTDDHYYGY